MIGFTAQQHEAAHTLGEHLCVDAGAGSGKTAVLVERVMHLLEQGVELRRIVAITFTRKAAGEMKERLREAIHRRPANDPKSMDKWRALELEVQTARITTIDGFCAALLHENALQMGLDPDFAILDQDEAELLRAEVAENTVVSLLDGKDNAAQLLAVEHGLENITTYLAAILNLIGPFNNAAAPYAGLSVDQLASLWKTRANEFEAQRHAELAASPALARLIAELRSYGGDCTNPANRIEAARCEALRCLEAIALNENVDATCAGVAGLGKVNLQGGSTKEWPSKDAMDEVKAIVKEAREFVKDYESVPYDPVIESAAARLTLDLIEIVGKVDAAYREAKQRRTALDFSDLLRLTVEMLDRADLRARITGGIQHLLVDEFQDTNQAQLALASLLTRKAKAELFVVGDAKQSIYRFRGAEVEVFAEVKQWTQRTLRLDENFRSVSPLIEFINDFFEKSGLLTRVESDFVRLTASRTLPEKCVVEFLIPAERDKEEGGDDDDEQDPPRVQEAALIAGRIAELCGPDGIEIFDKETKAFRRAQFGDVAVLYRATTNASVYEDALRRLNVPANVIAGAGYYTRQEILDLHNLSSVALDPWNEAALAAFLRSPLAGVTDDTLMRLTRTTKLAESFWSEHDVGSVGENEILKNARSLIRFIQDRREWPVSALLRVLLNETGFEAVLLAQYHGLQKAGNIHKLTQLARESANAGRIGLHAFTQRLSALARGGLRAGDAELGADTRGAVTLMTVHNAKGLEFPIVVIADMGRCPGGGRQSKICVTNAQHGVVAAAHSSTGKLTWPALGEHLKRLDKEDELAEEARVLYVAMTRARDRLLLAGPAKSRINSWQSALNSVFGLEERRHNEEISGTNWTARVVGQTTQTPLAAPPQESAAKLDFHALDSQAKALSPSISAGHVVPVRALLDWMHPGNAGANSARSSGSALDRRQLGTAAHAVLERWEFTGDAPVDAVTREYFPAAAQRDAARRELNAMAQKLASSELWPRLKNAKTLQRELPFLYDVGGVFLSGVIDVWLDDGTLIDYKLSKPSAERLTRYETQLRLYTAAIRAATGAVPRAALLYYLGSGEMESVSLSNADLDACVARAKQALQPLSPA